MKRHNTKVLKDEQLPDAQSKAGHKTDTNYLRYRHNTSLSDHIWSLKEQDKEYDLKWMLIDRGKAFNPIQKKCKICLKDKFHIMYNRSGASPNRRKEVFNICRHRNQNLLSKSRNAIYMSKFKFINL